ncbi:MAG: bile acid:sodium symporter [Myxococcota bacterium]
MTQTWIDLGLGVGMFLLMLGMGLTLVTDDFRRVATNPRATLVGTLLQLVVMPCVGLLLANLFALPPILAAGIVVVAACPGGMFSNMYIHFAKANTALSITLTATATLVTLFTLPLWVQFSITRFGAQEDAAVAMPVVDTALRLGTLTILPVVIGMIARARNPNALRYERYATIPGAIAIVLGAGLGAGNNPELEPSQFVESLAPAAAFAFAAMFVGMAVPLLFRVPPRDAVTIAVEMIVKNTLLGIVLVSQVLDFEAVLPIFAFALFQTPGGIVLLVGWRWFERRERSRRGDAEP